MGTTQIGLGQNKHGGPTHIEDCLTLRADSWPNENLHLHPFSKTTIFTYEIVTP
jgi:hypothetical protein